MPCNIPGPNQPLLLQYTHTSVHLLGASAEPHLQEAKYSHLERLKGWWLSGWPGPTICQWCPVHLLAEGCLQASMPGPKGMHADFDASLRCVVFEEKWVASFWAKARAPVPWVRISTSGGYQHQHCSNIKESIMFHAQALYITSSQSKECLRRPV